MSHYILLKNVLNITQLIEPSLPLGLGMLCWEHSVNVAVSWSSVPFQFTSLQAVSNKKSLQTSASTTLFNFFKMFLVLGKCVYTFTMKWLLAYTEKTISYLYYGYTKKKKTVGSVKNKHWLLLLLPQGNKKCKEDVSEDVKGLSILRPQSPQYTSRGTEVHIASYMHAFIRDSHNEPQRKCLSVGFGFLQPWST